MPGIEWTFLEEERTEARAIYCKVEKKSTIWVERDPLERAKTSAKSIKDYAKKLMWTVIILAEDLLKAQDLKARGVGFSKLFGKVHIDSVYRKGSDYYFCFTSISCVKKRHCRSSGGISPKADSRSERRTLDQTHEVSTGVFGKVEKGVR